MSSTGLDWFWVEVLSAITLINNFAEEGRNMEAKHRQTDGRRYPWIATGKAKNKHRTNEQTRTTEVTAKNRLATHQYKQEFRKTEKKRKLRLYQVETTRDLNIHTRYIHLVDRVVTCFNDLLVASAEEGRWRRELPQGCTKMGVWMA